MIFLSIIGGIIGMVLFGTIIDYFLNHRSIPKSHTPLIHRKKREIHESLNEQEIDEIISFAATHDFIPLEEFFKDFVTTNDARMEAGGASNYKDVNIMSIKEEELSITGAPSIALTYKDGEEMAQIFTHTPFLRDIITAFSIRRSVEHLLRESGPRIRCLHGLKVISIVWVIIGHSFLLSMDNIENPKHLVEQIQSKIFGKWLFNSSLSVDSFFLISGAVLAFSFRKRLIGAKNDETRLSRLFSIPRWLIIFFHRLLRLLPTYAVILGFTITIFNQLGDGPMWKNEGVFGSKCNGDDWWHHLLFISNFFPTECMPWMWYLSLNMQFYLISPFLLFLLYKVPSFGKFAAGVLVLCCGIYRFIVYKLFDFPSNFTLKMYEKEAVISEDGARMFGLLYAAPSSRIAPFVIGIFLGWILAVKKRTKLFKPRPSDFKFLTLLSMKILSIILIIWAIHGPGFEYLNNKWFEIFYSSQQRIIWSIGLALMVWLCERGHFEPFEAILGWDKWVPVSRLCFGIYLTHELIIILFVYQRRLVWMVENPYEVIIFALGITVLSVFCAALLAIFVELPHLTLERKLFMRIRKNVALRRNDSGNFTISECQKSMLSMKAVIGKGKSNCAASFTTVREHENEKDTLMEVLPKILPTTKSEKLVTNWLDQAVNDAIRQEQIEPTPATTENDSVFDGVETDDELLKVYPWDNSQWNSDSRINQSTLQLASSSPSYNKETNLATQVSADGQEDDCVEVGNFQIEKIIRQI